MMGKYAQCAFLFMVNWLGQCPSAVSQHPESPGACTHTTAPWSEVVVAAGSPGNMGTLGLAKALPPSLPGKAGRWGLCFCPLLRSFGMKDGLGLASAWWLCPSKMYHGNSCCSSLLKKGSQPRTGHRLHFIHCVVPLGCFQMWYIPPVNVFNWQAPGSLFECCLSLWVWDGWAVQNDFL